jgi:thioester reductase-like protein
MSQLNKIVFLTGATGLVGGNLIPRILKDQNVIRLILLIRGGSDKKAEQRVDEMLGTLYPKMDKDQAKTRIQVVRGDITLDKLGLSENVYNNLAKEVTHIIHSAATVQFQLPLECARLVNCTGTENVMNLAHCAQKSGNLKRVAYISTAYVAGDREGLILETELDYGQQFSNTYERTKLEAEKIIRLWMNKLPVTIFRPSIIVGDSQTGRTTAFNVLYPPLKLIHHGLVQVLPGSENTSLDVVPVDFVADAINYLFLKTNHGIGKTYHLTAGKENSTTVAEVVDGAVDYFNRIGGNLQRVKFMSVERYHKVEKSLLGYARRIWQAMEMYEPYVSVNRIFDNGNTCSALQGTGITVPDFRTYFHTILGYCLQTDWGKSLKDAA